MNFSKISMNFHWFRFAICEKCRVYTRNDSSARNKWAREHDPCGTYRFADAAPEGYDPELEPLEAFASIGEQFEQAALRAEEREEVLA